MDLPLPLPQPQNPPPKSERTRQNPPPLKPNDENDRMPSMYKADSSSDSESDAPEISDDEIEDIAITPPPRSRRGAKKDPTPNDEEAFENSYPLEGQYKDEADRERLLAMTEFEREKVLFARAEEIKQFKEKAQLAALLKEQAAKDQPRRSGREGQLRSEKAGKRDELSELKKRREEKSNAAKVKVYPYFSVLIRRQRS